MKPRVDYTLYLCTDRELMSAERLEKAVELAIQGGVTVVQLREKDCTGREFLQIAKDVKQITDAYEIPLIINDRIDIAMAVDADGVHLGQSDIPAHTARELLGPDKIIGYLRTIKNWPSRRKKRAQTIWGSAMCLELRRKQERIM